MSNEPDYLHWVDPASDLDCLIVRNGMGALCGYVGDLVPGMIQYGLDRGVYRDIEYVKAECASLALQLKEAA